MSITEFAALFGVYAALQVAVLGGVYAALRHQLTDLDKNVQALIMGLDRNVQAQIDRGKKEHEEFRRDIKELYGDHRFIRGQLDTVIQLLQEKDKS